MVGESLIFTNPKKKSVGRIYIKKNLKKWMGLIFAKTSENGYKAINCYFSLRSIQIYSKLGLTFANERAWTGMSDG